MSVGSAMNSALSGIQQSFDKLDLAASRIAAPADVDQVTQSAIETIEAKHGVKVNTRVLQVADEMLGTMLDMLV